MLWELGRWWPKRALTTSVLSIPLCNYSNPAGWVGEGGGRGEPKLVGKHQAASLRMQAAEQRTRDHWPTLCSSGRQNICQNECQLPGRLLKLLQSPSQPQDPGSSLSNLKWEANHCWNQNEFGTLTPGNSYPDSPGHFICPVLIRPYILVKFMDPIDHAIAGWRCM